MYRFHLVFNKKRMSTSANHECRVRAPFRTSSDLDLSTADVELCDINSIGNIFSMTPRGCAYLSTSVVRRAVDGDVLDADQVSIP